MENATPEATPEAAAFWWVEKSMSDLFNSSSWDYLFPSPAACESHVALGQALSTLRLIQPGPMTDEADHR